MLLFSNFFKKSCIFPENGLLGGGGGQVLFEWKEASHDENE